MTRRPPPVIQLVLPSCRFQWTRRYDLAQSEKPHGRVVALELSHRGDAFIVGEHDVQRGRINLIGHRVEEVAAGHDSENDFEFIEFIKFIEFIELNRKPSTGD